MLVKGLSICWCLCRNKIGRRFQESDLVLPINSPGVAAVCMLRIRRDRMKSVNWNILAKEENTRLVKLEVESTCQRLTIGKNNIVIKIVINCLATRTDIKVFNLLRQGKELRKLQHGMYKVREQNKRSLPRIKKDEHRQLWCHRNQKKGRGNETIGGKFTWKMLCKDKTWS